MKKDVPFLSPTSYFPPAGWLRTAIHAGEWRLEAHENYQKSGFRKRCRILGPNGVQTLSVPLNQGKHQRQPIREVTISYEVDWWRTHEQAIRTAYGRSPYFEFYADALFAVGRKQHPTLWELNEELLQTILRLLRQPVPLTLTEDFVRPEDEGYLRPNDSRIDSPPPYPQVFSDRFGFVADLSVLDALFCLGPEVVTR